MVRDIDDPENKRCTTSTAYLWTQLIKCRAHMKKLVIVTVRCWLTTALVSDGQSSQGAQSGGLDPADIKKPAGGSVDPSYS
jgi:hypothetical protein